MTHQEWLEISTAALNSAVEDVNTPTELFYDDEAQENRQILRDFLTQEGVETGRWIHYLTWEAAIMACRKRGLLRNRPTREELEAQWRAADLRDGSKKGQIQASREEVERRKAAEKARFEEFKNDPFGALRKKRDEEIARKVADRETVEAQMTALRESLPIIPLHEMTKEQQRAFGKLDAKNIRIHNKAVSDAQIAAKANRKIDVGSDDSPIR